MAKAKTIKPVNPHSSFLWSEMLDPVAVKPKVLPEKAGLYMVVACDLTGKPIDLPGAPKNTKMPGVVYIGLTRKDNTLKKRFMQLARASRVKHNWKTAPHGSRTHYESDKAAKRLFAVSNVRIRYMSLPSDPRKEKTAVVAEAKKQGISPQELRSAFGMSLTGDRLVADSEAMAIQWFRRQHRYIPILNRREEGRGDRPATDNELDDFLKKT